VCLVGFHCSCLTGTPQPQAPRGAQQNTPGVSNGQQLVLPPPCLSKTKDQDITFLVSRPQLNSKSREDTVASRLFSLLLACQKQRIRT